MCSLQLVNVLHIFETVCILLERPASLYDSKHNCFHINGIYGAILCLAFDQNPLAAWKASRLYGKITEYA